MVRCTERLWVRHNIIIIIHDGTVYALLMYNMIIIKKSEKNMYLPSKLL